ncbi:MAG: nucleotidyltransferase family protein, partial [Proteobacteria bacterium]|nr:nucleotidyltransferase family protein [Pseudomonadota bacterium]
MRPETYAALVSVAAALVSNSNASQLAPAFALIEDWQELASEAERHGLSVMLGRLSANDEIKLPRELDLQLKALSIRHRRVLAARRIVLAEVIDLFGRHNIAFAFLKGAALANLIYDPPWLRPMRDIDMLVDSENALQAQKLLREIDFKNEDYAPGYLFEHHHLPNSTR